MEKYVECQNCQEQYDCERTYLGGCTDGKEWEEKPLLSKSDKEFYFALMTNCKKVIEKCPNIEERRLACEYCRFEQVRKKAVEEYEQKLENGELVSKDWHDEQVLHAENEIEKLKKDYIELYLECRKLRAELDKELAEHEEFTKKDNSLIELQKENIETTHKNNMELREEIESLKSKSSFKDSWKNKFFKAQEEIERLMSELKIMERNLTVESRNYEDTKIIADLLKGENVELQKQVDELKAFKNEAISMSLYAKGRKDGEEIGYQLGKKFYVGDEVEKAVKDTAKEILTELLHTSFEKTVTVSNYKKSKEDIEIVAKVILTSINEKIKEIAKRKGVEVE